jgi:iron complex outermembrane recepter protein
MLAVTAALILLSSDASDTTVDAPSGQASEAGQFALGVGDALNNQKAADPQESAAILTVASTKELLDERGILTLGQFLASTPGFDYLPAFWHNWPGARGLRDSVSAMIDGVVVNSPTDYRYSASHGLFLEEFERVEVISGPAGVSWGAYSLLGAVNLITGRSRVDGTSVRATYGTRDLIRLSARDDRQLGSGRLRLFVGGASIRKPSIAPATRYEGVPPYTKSWYSVPNTEASASDADVYGTISAHYERKNLAAYIRLT